MQDFKACVLVASRWYMHDSFHIFSSFITFGVQRKDFSLPAQALESGALLLKGLSYSDMAVGHAAGQRGCCGADPGGGKKPL